MGKNKSGASRATRSRALPIAGLIPDERVTGVVKHLYYKGDHFTAGQLSLKEDKTISFAGKFGGVNPNDAITLIGSWTEDPKFGKQFKVSSFMFADASTELDQAGLVSFLFRNPKLTGIGPAIAERIVTFCNGQFSEIVSSPERWPELLSIPGVTRPIAENLHEVWVARAEHNSTISQLAALGLTWLQIEKLLTAYGANAAVMARENPYAFIKTIDGWGFFRADEIGRKAGIPKHHPDRIRAAINHVIGENLNSAGHTWTERRSLILEADALLKMDTEQDRQGIEAVLDLMLALNNTGAVTIPDTYDFEDDIIEYWENGSPRLVSTESALNTEKYLAKIFKDHGNSPHGREFKFGAEFDALTPEQRAAALNAAKCRISLLSGGAGTGKTTTIRAIVEGASNAGLHVALCAPTGKAARRMEESINTPTFEHRVAARTIHRLLEHNGRCFQYDEHTPISYDLVIVDEISMCDIFLLQALFRAIRWETTSLVIVGDHNQLPPVGPGNPLRDIIRNHLVPTTVLTHCHRQAGKLKANSSAILEGRVEPDTSRPGILDSWYVISNLKVKTLHTPDDYRNFIADTYQTVLVEKFGYDLIADVQLLTPTHTGPLGTRALNILLQTVVQRKLFGITPDPTPDNKRPKLLMGDKIMNHKNNYDLGIMNGSVGILRDVKKACPEKCEKCLDDIIADPSACKSAQLHHIIEFDGVGMVSCPPAAMQHINLAYAATVHKFQGAEIPCAIYVCHKSHSFMHHRNLFYTAVTRARRTAIIIGDSWGISNCAKKVETDRRRTFLSLEELL